MRAIVLYIDGLASRSRQEISFQEKEKTISLMDFLRLKSVSIASSCYGEGVCKKCVLKINNEEKLSCQIPMSFFTEESPYIIEIDYL